MTRIGCAEVKDLLPESIRRELPESDRAVVAAHVSSCASCSEEVELLEWIRGAAYTTPASLASEIKSAVAAGIESDAGVAHGGARRFAHGQGGRFAHWRLAAAATVVLALGTGLLWQRMPRGPEDGLGPLSQDPLAVVWPSDDGDVAGVAILADLSDEDLALLLEELGG